MQKNCNFWREFFCSQFGLNVHVQARIQELMLGGGGGGHHVLARFWGPPTRHDPMMNAEICTKKETLEQFPPDLQPFPLDEYPPSLSLGGGGGGLRVCPRLNPHLMFTTLAQF